MKKNQIILIIIGVLIIIGLASGISFWFGQKSSKTEKEIVLPPFLNSKMIQKWNAVASGEILKIADREITITGQGEILIVPMAETAKIYFSDLNGETKEEKLKEIQLSDLKIRDNVNIQVGIKDKQIEGEVLTVTAAK